MTVLPQNKNIGLRDALAMIALTGLEKVTQSLRMGDGFDLDSLTPLVNRCRALVAAYDERIKEVEK